MTLSHKKRSSSFILLLLLLLLGLNACAHSEGEALSPIDPASWPTPPPAQAEATATPFPEIDLALFEPTAKPTQIIIDDLPSQASTPTPVPPTATPEPSPTAVPATATPAPEADAPAATASVASYGLNLRSGPNAGFDVVQELAQGDSVEILGRNPNSGWVNIRTDSGAEGWVNPEFLNMDGAVSDLPTSASASKAPSGNSIANSTSNVASPSPSAGGRLLVQPVSGGNILIINRDGTGLQTLTQGIDPALSPDGTRVAFTRWDGGNTGSLWLINTDGTGERMILGEMRKVKSPSWSPDSQQIAVNFQEGGTIEVQKICHNLADGEPDINYFLAYDVDTEVKEDPDSPFGFSVFLCWKYPPDPHWKMRVIDVDTGDYEDKPAGQYAFAPAWDPARAWRVVSTAGLGLVQTDINQGTASPLTDDPADRAPVFSPDGQYMAVSYYQHDHWEVHRLNADGTGRVRLTKTPLYAVAENTPIANNAAPTFSPDGTEIAFLTDRTGEWEVWVMDINGENQRPLFPESVSSQLEIQYQGNDERALRWGL